MQAIITKYYGPSNVKGSRFLAKCDAGKIIVPYDHGISHEANHIAAAKKLAEKLEWTGDWYGKLASGYLPNGSYVHVFTGKVSN